MSACGLEMHFGVLGALARGQGGLVTAARARAAGIERTRCARLVRAGLLEAADRRVYRLTADDLPRHLDIRIAWLRMDSGRTQRDGLGANDGVVSHGSACLVHAIGDIPAPLVELTVPTRRRIAVP